MCSALSIFIFCIDDFEQYAEVVGYALKNEVIGGSSKCLDAVAGGVTAVASALNAGSREISALPQALQPCTTMNGPLDLAMYESAIFGALQGTVQYNLEASPITVAKVCKAAVSAGPGVATAAAVMALFANQSAPFEKRCLQSSWTDDMIAPLLNVTFDGTSSMRQWIWQSCNEFGFFQTTVSPSKLNPFRPFVHNDIATVGKTLCEEVYGFSNYSGAATISANINYGGRSVITPGITFPNGDSDPWHALGVVDPADHWHDSCVESRAGANCPKQRLGTDDVAVTINGTAHCRDMYAPGALAPYGTNDTAAVAAAHAIITSRVAEYLS